MAKITQLRAVSSKKLDVWRFLNLMLLSIFGKPTPFALQKFHFCRLRSRSHFELLRFINRVVA